MSDWELDASNMEQSLDNTMIENSNEEMEFQELKKEKAKAKSAFTKSRHKLLQLLDDDITDRSEIKELQRKVENHEEHAMQIFEQLFGMYKHRHDHESMQKTTKEMEQMETEFTEVENETQHFLIDSKEGSSISSRRSVNTSAVREEEKRLRNTTRQHGFSHIQQTIDDGNNSEIGKDMWKQLKRISIPVFSGEKRSYESWKAAFMSCVDRAPATPEYKLLQLRQYVSGEALQVIENLGYSAAAYEAAKERLERRYGGKRRQVVRHLEDLEQFKPIREGYSKDIEKFADLIDIAVVNLKDVGRTEELGNGSLYSKLQQKLPESMLARYHRWVFEKRKFESVESLREWIIQEAEFQTIASETIRGLDSLDVKKTKKDSNRTFVSNSENSNGNSKNYRKRLCKVCNGNHGAWNCDVFKQMEVSKRWAASKENKLCYRCLGDDHIGSKCLRSRKCNIQGCEEVHHRMLHKNRNNRNGNRRNTSSFSSGLTSEDRESIESFQLKTDTPNEGERENRTMIVNERQEPRFVTLRTVPVILRNGNRKIKVNALLDDASTKTYVNSDVAAELGLQGSLQTVTVNVLNDSVESFQTMPVEFELESLNGKTKTRVNAYTTERVTGDMQVIDWRKHSSKWEHLKGIDFPNIGSRQIVDVLIGLDYSDLHYSIRDVRGKPGEPMARLTPLGWTCIGKVISDKNQTHFNRTYFVDNKARDSDVEVLLKNFWEIESVKSIDKTDLMSEDEKQAVKCVEDSMTFRNGHYEVAVPWKSDPAELPDNYDMAFRRLQNTEKRLEKNPQVANDYSKTIDQYVEKGYVKKVIDVEKEKNGKWYLPHFPVLKPDRETTKTRIVFDASARYKGVSINDVIHQGPKLQQDLFDVLLRFRKNPVAIVCDIAEMYLRIKIFDVDRPYHRFLWRSMNTDKTPEVYEFSSVVFGVNSSPFQAQFVSRKNAEMMQDSHVRAAETVLKSTYMDDSMDSVLSDSEGIELYNQLSDLWSKAGMHARKWLSNSKAVLECIPENERASEVNIEDGILPTVKTLGVMWRANDDIFTFNADPLCIECEYIITFYIYKT